VAPDGLRRPVSAPARVLGAAQEGRPARQVRPGWAAAVRDYLALTKPRIVLLLMVTAYCAMVVAQGGLPAPGLTVWTLLGLGLSAGGANAINMWYDRDIDRVMARTRGRPLPQGRLSPAAALRFGIACGVISLVLLAWTVGPLAAALALAGYAYYVLVYTVWLKRRTPLNIVIGGAAGSFPPLVGWAAVTGHLSVAAWLMFAIIFLWTPPHFWTLALYKQDDYRRAGIPMLPVARGGRETRRQSLLYALSLLAASVGLYFTGTVGPLYLMAALVLGGSFVAYLVALTLSPEGETLWAKRSFRFSLVYLAGLFGAMVLSVHP
jgi:protoheme IX farnesyltransferase